jgi:hypothetical protein
MKNMLGKTQRITLILAMIGLAMYGAGWLWSVLYAKNHADANIGAGLLGLAGLALGGVALVVFIVATLSALFKKH